MACSGQGQKKQPQKWTVTGQTATTRIGSIEAIVDSADLVIVGQHRWWLSSGYIQTSINSKNTTMHRLLLPDSKEVDHINRVRHDNRRSNLRQSSKSLNMHNKGSLKNKTSGFKGVYARLDRCPVKYVAQICLNYKSVHLGTFKTGREAALAYDRAATEAYGQEACTNASLGLI